MKDLPSSFSSHSLISLRSISSTSISNSNSGSENGPSFCSAPFHGGAKTKAIDHIYDVRKRNLLVDKDRPDEARRQKKKKKGGEKGANWSRETMAPWDHHRSPLSPPRIFPLLRHSVSPRRDTFQSRNLKLVNYSTIVVSRPPIFAVHPRLSVPDNRKGVFLHFPEIFRLTSARADREWMISEDYWK